MKVDNAHRDRHAQDQRRKHEDHPLRGDRTLIGERLLDDAAVVCRGCQRDGVLLTLLQQHDIQRGLDLLLAGDRHELLLLPRGVADAALELARLTVDVRLGDLETLQDTVHRRLHVAAHSLDAGVHVDDRRVAVRRGAQQALALDDHCVVLVDDRGEVLIPQAHVGRDHLVHVRRIVDIIAEILHQVDLRGVLRTLLLIPRAFLQSHLGVARQIRQAGALLEGSELALRSAQLAVDDADALLDELRRLLRHLVLLVVGVLVVERHKAIDEVHASSPHRVPQGYLGDRRRLGRGRHAQLLAVSLGRGRGRMDVGHQLDLPALQLRYGIHARETENPHGGGQYGGEPVEALLHRLPVTLLIDLILGPHAQPPVHGIAHAQLHGGHQTVRLLGGDEHVNGGVPV